MKNNLQILKDALEIQYYDNHGELKCYLSPSEKELIVILFGERFVITTSISDERLFDVEDKRITPKVCLTIFEVLQMLN